MGIVNDSFLSSVLREISAPVTGNNIAACHAWMRAEGGNARNNPFNTTQGEPGATPYNSFGPNGQYHVMNYPDGVTGIKATVTTLLNGHYAAIVDAFRHDAGRRICTAVDASVWGTHGCAASWDYLQGHAPATHRILEVSTPPMTGSDVREVQQALQRHGLSVGHAGADGVYGLATMTAVETFQSRNKLASDGVVGPATRKALGLAA